MPARTRSWRRSSETGPIVHTSFVALLAAMRPEDLLDHADHRVVVPPVRRWVLGQRFRDLAIGMTRCELEPGMGDLVGDVTACHLGEIERPRSGNHAGPLIPASPRGHPPATGHVVSQL